MKRLHAVVFDLDGTLIDSKIEYEKMAEEIRGVFVSEGIPVNDLDDRVKVYKFILEGDSALEGYGLERDKIDHIQDKLMVTMNRIKLEAVDKVEKISNAEETLRALKHRGLSIGIATRGGHEYAERSLSLTGLRGYIDALLARDRVRMPKPHPMHLLHVIDMLKTSTENVIYIGDTPTDFRTSRAAGVTFYGYNRDAKWFKRLVEVGCKKIINDLCDVVYIVDDFPYCL